LFKRISTTNIKDTTTITKSIIIQLVVIVIVTLSKKNTNINITASITTPKKIKILTQKIQKKLILLLQRQLLSQKIKKWLLIPLVKRRILRNQTRPNLIKKLKTKMHHQFHLKIRNCNSVPRE